MSLQLWFVVLVAIASDPRSIRVVNGQNTNCNIMVDLAFIVDGSASICGRLPPGATTCDAWKLNLQFIHTIVDSLTIGPIGSRVALILFSDSAKVEWNLNRYADKAALLSAIDNLRYPAGQTNTTGALRLLVSDVFVGSAGDRFFAPNAALLITDGVPNIDTQYLSDAVTAVHNTVYKIFVVGVTSSIPEEIVKQISSSPQRINETYFLATDYGSLVPVLYELQKQTCPATPY